MAESKGSLIAKSVSKHAGRAKEKVRLIPFLIFRIDKLRIFKKIILFFLLFKKPTSSAHAIPAFCFSRYHRYYRY